MLPFGVFFDNQFLEILKEKKLSVDMALTIPKKKKFEYTGANLFLFVISKIEQLKRTFFSELTTKIRR